MVIELRPDEFEKARSAFRSESHSLAIESILKGLTSARVFVGSVESPGWALTWFKGKVWFGGKPDDPACGRTVHRLLHEGYMPGLASRGWNAFELHCNIDEWRDNIEDILKDMKWTEAGRQYLRLRASEGKRDIAGKDRPGLLPINTALLSRSELKNLGAVKEEMQSERVSVEDFLRKSFGYCALRGTEIVGWCMSEYNVGDRCEIGIATVEEYRRRGIATLTGTAVIGHASSRGITEIGWHCWADNEASIRTARRLGFRRERDYAVLLVKFGSNVR